MDGPEDHELSLLQRIYRQGAPESGALSQREIARDAGLSLGMTNALIRRFAEKGWVVAQRANSRNLSYLITPEGAKEMARRLQGYFRRTARTASFYKERLEELVMREKRGGMRRLVLAGPSDLDFILEYLCERHGVLFVRGAEPDQASRLSGEGTLLLFSEQVPDEAIGPGGLSLRDIAAGLGSGASQDNYRT